MSGAPVLVVTGPTGAGKSTVCSWLAERGAWWIEADTVGHEVLERREVRERLVEDFGAEILSADGTIDRRALGDRVFGDEAALGGLNSVVHPPLVAEILRRIEVLRASREVELIVVDAALHFQFEPPLPADLVLGLRAGRDERMRRVRERDGLDASRARHRMMRQEAVEASLDRADAVLDSDTAPEALREQLFAVIDERLSTEFTLKAGRLATTRTRSAPDPHGERNHE